MININLKWVLIIVGVLLAVILGFYIHTVNLERKLAVATDSVLVSRQNVKALQDQYDMTKDTLQTYSVMVSDIQNINNNLLWTADELRNKYSLIYNKYLLYVDTVNILRRKITEFTDDSTHIIIPFEGKVKKVSYSGNTTYYKKTKVADYTIYIAVDPITILNEIYYSKQDSTVKSKVYADGLLIDSAKTVVDPYLYLLIHPESSHSTPDNPIHKPGFFDNLLFTMEYSNTLIYDATIQSKSSNVSVGLAYSFGNAGVGLKRNLLLPEYVFSLKYNISVSNLFNLIF